MSYINSLTIYWAFDENYDQTANFYELFLFRLWSGSVTWCGVIIFIDIKWPHLLSLQSSLVIKSSASSSLHNSLPISSTLLLLCLLSRLFLFILLQHLRNARCYICPLRQNAACFRRLWRVFKFSILGKWMDSLVCSLLCFSPFLYL